VIYLTPKEHLGNGYPQLQFGPSGLLNPKSLPAIASRSGEAGGPNLKSKIEEPAPPNTKHQTKIL
jgi:hypothetical protein